MDDSECVAVGPESEEDWYFGEYGRIATHREMLEDNVRTRSYRKAIGAACPGKLVLEVGCGSGILSMFAAQAGARRVIAVEGSARMADLARENIKLNGFSDVVHVLTGRLEDVLDEVDALIRAACNGGLARVDVVLSEWMGYMLVHEDMFPTVALARDRWLAPDGVMLPARCSLWAAPFSGEEFVEDIMGFWNSRPYGLDLSALGRPALRELTCRPVIDDIEDENSVLAQPARLWRFRCAAVTAEATRNQTLTLDFEVTRPGPLDGVAVWFICTLADGVGFSTGPGSAPTHWAQTMLYLDPDSDASGLKLEPGDRLSGELRWSQAGRGMLVDLEGRVRQADGSETPFAAHYNWSLRP